MDDLESGISSLCDLVNELRDQVTRITAERDAALAHAERLAGALGKAEEALVHLDEGALGFVEVPTGEDRDGCFIYPLRDELLGHIRAALASWQERG